MIIQCVQRTVKHHSAEFSNVHWARPNESESLDSHKRSFPPKFASNGKASERGIRATKAWVASSYGARTDIRDARRSYISLALSYLPPDFIEKETARYLFLCIHIDINVFKKGLLSALFTFKKYLMTWNFRDTLISAKFAIWKESRN